MEQDELAFLEDLNALISQALEEGADPGETLRTIANEVRSRIDALEQGDS